MSGRRDFLGGLVSLPLIGGGVTLIGQPSAVAEPVTIDMLEAYKTWLFYERRSLAWNMARHPRYTAYYKGLSQKKIYSKIEPSCVYAGESGSFHSYDGTNPPESRAALVLTTVGCDWREPS